LAAGHRVVALDNLSTSSGRTLPPDVHLVQGAVGDRVVLDRIFETWKIQAVFHFAADTRVGESMVVPLDYYRHNVGESLRLLEAVVAAGAPPFIFSSSAAVYGIPATSPVAESAPVAPINPYGETKAVFERALHWAGLAHGLPWAALRYFNAAGAEGPWERKEPETHLIPLVLAATSDQGPALSVFGQDYPTPDGTGVRDYIHVSDLGAGHLAALAHLRSGGASGCFNLGTGQGSSVAEVIAAVERVTDRKVRWQAAPRRAGDPPALVADATRAGAELGWHAEHSSLDEIVRDAWRAWQATEERV
jgi:UDP-glucose-4-epimerase GalE